MQQIALGMHAAHLRGIIHRDLKPANVLVTKDDCPKVSDFGIAKNLADVAHTETGAILGTPCYMAPEQALGKQGEIGPATDVYGLGAILYHLLTGRPPFEGSSALTVLRHLEKREAIPPRQLVGQVPKDLETICLKCLEKAPQQRYSSAEALAQDLGRFLAGEPIVARPAGSLERLAKWVRRRPERALIYFLLLLAVLEGALLCFSSAGQKAPTSSSEAMPEGPATPGTHPLHQVPK